MATTNLSPSEISSLSVSYARNNVGDLESELKPKSMTEHISDHKFKFFHIFIIAGLTYFILRQHQLTEGPVKIFSG